MSAVKHDGGKPMISLVNRRAIEEEARVMMFGLQKYGRDNWRGGMAFSRCIDAGLRHLHAFADGEDLDEETGLSHLAHARCCLAFLLEYLHTHPELDDRYGKQKTGNSVHRKRAQPPVKKRVRAEKPQRVRRRNS